MNAKICPHCNEEKEFSFFPKDRTRTDGYGSYCKSCKNKYKAKYREENIIEIRKKHQLYKKERLQNDSKYRMIENFRGRVRSAFKHKKWTKTGSTKHFGCDAQTAINHIENQFVNGMSWENYGQWHIDHIIPLSSANTIEEMEKLNHYTNLQPLWAIDNIRKGNSVPNKVDKHELLRKESKVNKHEFF